MEVEEDHHQHKFIKSQNPHFFKIILQDTLQSKKLVIPKNFVGKYGVGLGLDRVYLKVSSGDMWEVELQREEDGHMWLLNGWQEFVEFYEIKFGYFLVFGYLGNSEFQVLIFDKSTSEIKYPRRSKNNEEHNADAGPCLLCAKPEIEDSHAEMLADWVYDNAELGNSNDPRENAQAVIRSTAFDSPNPSFQIIMRKTYVNKNYVLWLPGRFIMEHIGPKKFYMTLSVPCGRLWTAKCRFRMHGSQPDARVQQGWRPFVRDNNLVVGDVCIFELIDYVKVHFLVTIFRAAKDPSFSPCLVKSESEECIGRQITPKHLGCEELSSDIQYAATRNHTSKNPSFKLVMTESRVRSRKAPILDGFLEHLKPSTQVLALEVAGRLWWVKICRYRRAPGKEGIFSMGWTKFVRENSLQVGDICIFELIEREEAVVKVSIHRSAQTEWSKT